MPNNRISGKVDYTYIGKVERGEQYPSLKMLERIGRSFSVPLSYFFEDDSIKKSLDLLPQEIKNLLYEASYIFLLICRGLIHQTRKFSGFINEAPTKDTQLFMLFHIKDR